MKKAVIVLVMLLSAANIFAQTDELYITNPGEAPQNWIWDTRSVNSYEYVDLAWNGHIAGAFWAVSDNSRADAVNRDLGLTFPINSQSYNSVANNHDFSSYCFAARSDGSVLDAIWFDGTQWQTTPIVTGSYRDVTTLGSVHNFAAAKTDGTGVDKYFWSGTGWQLENITASPYDTIISDPYTTNSLYAIGADGSVDNLWFDGSSWQTTVLNNANSYNAIAVDTVNDNAIVAARADGGLDVIADAGSGWTTTSALASGNFSNLQGVTGVSDYFIGSGPNGVYTIQNIAGSWSSGLISSESYVTLLRDVSNLNVYASIPEPATFVLFGIGTFVLRRKR